MAGQGQIVGPGQGQAPPIAAIGPIKALWDGYKLYKALRAVDRSGSTLKTIRDVLFYGGIWWAKEEAEDAAKGNFIEGTYLADPDNPNLLPRIIIVKAGGAIVHYAGDGLVMPPMWLADP